METEQQTKADVHAPAPLGAAQIYARLFPFVALGLIALMLAKDALLSTMIEGPDAIRVQWGLRTLRSAKDSEDEMLVRTYREAADLIGAHLAQQDAENGAADQPPAAPMTPEQRAGGRDTQAAYTSLDVRGWLTIVILAVGSLFLLASGALAGASLRDRLRLHLLGVGCLLVAIRWFRWCFDSVADKLAYARDGDYGYAAPAITALVGSVLLSVLFLCVYLAHRRGSKQT